MGSYNESTLPNQRRYEFGWAALPGRGPSLERSRKAHEPPSLTISLTIIPGGRFKIGTDCHPS